MDGGRRVFPLVAVLFVIGVSGIARFSQNVRAVEAVGLSGGGFALGVGFALLVLGLRGKIKSDRATG